MTFVRRVGDSVVTHRLVFEQVSKETWQRLFLLTNQRHVNEWTIEYIMPYSLADR